MIYARKATAAYLKRPNIPWAVVEAVEEEA
jgi:hypothetical protein